MPRVKETEKRKKKSRSRLGSLFPSACELRKTLFFEEGQRPRSGHGINNYFSRQAGIPGRRTFEDGLSTLSETEIMSSETPFVPECTGACPYASMSAQNPFAFKKDTCTHILPVFGYERTKAEGISSSQICNACTDNVVVASFGIPAMTEFKGQSESVNFW